MNIELNIPTNKKLTRKEILELINKGAVLYRQYAVYSYYYISYNSVNYYNFNKASLKSLLSSNEITCIYKK